MSFSTLFLYLFRRLPSSTLFPYTTLFRSRPPVHAVRGAPGTGLRQGSHREPAGSGRLRRLPRPPPRTPERARRRSAGSCLLLRPSGLPALSRERASQDLLPVFRLDFFGLGSGRLFGRERFLLSGHFQSGS